MPDIRVLNELIIKKDGVSITYKLGTVNGYYNSADGKFYEEVTHVTEIEGAPNLVYADIAGNALYIYKLSTSSFVKISGEGGGSSDNLKFGYLNDEDGKFYEDDQYQVEIPGNADYLFIGLDNDTIYRYDTSDIAFVAIGGGTGTEYQAGVGIDITNGVISGDYTAGHGISIDNGVISDKTFVGTTAQWEALTSAQQAFYEERVLTDDEPDVQQKTNGHTIKDEDGVSKTQRSNLQFEGLDVTDDDVNDKTIVAPTTLKNEIYGVMGQNGAKNLIPYPYHRASGYSSNGATATYDEEGVLTVNKVAGSATAYFALFSSILYPDAKLFLAPNTEYILSMELEDAVNTSCFIQATNGVDLAAIRNKGTGKYEVTFTTPENLNFTTLGLYWGSGVIETNAKVKVMLRLASDTDDTYQPYAMTNKDLTTKITTIEENYQEVMLYHNIPRLVPKDITDYITDGSFWNRLNGANGYSLFEDIYVGDYIQMSRPISAYEQTQTYQATGSEYVTIAGLDTRMGDGDGGDSISVINYHHAVMVPGQGFGGTQHFGRSRMNSSNTTANGYVGSEMFTTTIGAVATSGSTATTASINQQLYAEFGSHLKTTRELLSNAMDSTRYNRFGQADGASSNWAWTTCQAVLMSEVECYGSIVWSSSGYDTGNANAQLPLFRHNKQAMNNRSAYYWLKNIASSASFCACSGNGTSSYDGASNANRCVRPRFILA